jgi:hypothetical protein
VQSFYLHLPSSWYYTHVLLYQVCFWHMVSLTFSPWVALNHYPTISVFWVAG